MSSNSQDSNCRVVFGALAVFRRVDRLLRLLITGLDDVFGFVAVGPHGCAKQIELQFEVKTPGRRAVRRYQECPIGSGKTETLTQSPVDKPCFALSCRWVGCQAFERPLLPATAAAAAAHLRGTRSQVAAAAAGGGGCGPFFSSCAIRFAGREGTVRNIGELWPLRLERSS